MSDDDINIEDDVDRRIEETKSGVTVTVKSKRGTGTNDRDEVKAIAHHADLDEAFSSVHKMNSIVKEQMRTVRRNDPNSDRDQ